MSKSDDEAARSQEEIDLDDLLDGKACLSVCILLSCWLPDVAFAI